MKNDQSNNPSSFGVEGDYMTAGIEAESPQGIPGRENPPPPPDDQGQTMSVAEMLKEKIQNVFSKKH